MRLISLFVLVMWFSAFCAGTGDVCSPADLKLRLVHERRFQLDGVLPLEKDAFWPGAQYVAHVTALPAAVKFVTTDGNEKLRCDLKAGDGQLPAPPFDVAVLVTGRAKPSVFVRKDGEVKLLGLLTLPKGFDPREEKYAKTLRFRAEGGAKVTEVALTAGIGQADIRFVTEGRENRPYVENGRLYFTFSSRGYGATLGMMSIDPAKPSDLRFEGTIFFDYGDGRLRNDIAADLFHDSESGEWRAYVCNFSTGGESGTKGRAPGGVNVAWSKDSPLHGVSVMKSKPLGLPAMNEDPDGIWDAVAGKWRLFLSEFCPDGVIRASMWESEKWDGPFVRLTNPVPADSTGTTIVPFGGRRYCLSGSADRILYVYAYPKLEKLGALRFDIPPWPVNAKGWAHGRVWPSLVELPDGRALMVTMDRANFPGMPEPNWTYGKLMVYVADKPDSKASPAEKVDTREGIGRVSGNCMPGPCLPHASVYPSPDTLWPRKERPGRGAPTNGFYPDDPCVGFSQLHCQGTGGTVTYGLFLVSPTTGSGESEEELASPLTLRETRPYRFCGRLEKWGCEVALAPTAHGAIYTFDFDSDGGRLVFNAKRKIALPVATSNAVVKVSDDGLTVSGGGTYFGNWNPAPYDCYFHSVQERKGRRITLRVAVSFKSEAKAREYLEKELAGRSLDEVSLAAKAIWDERLSCVEVGGLDSAEETKFYSQLFHAFVQPRDRTGDFAAWGGDEAVWDDHYTLWDTWKTLFPLMAIVDPAMVAGNVNSFAARLRKNGTVTAAFIQGREYRVGQGGDEQDNVIADAWAKKIPGIDWEGAWAVLEHDAAHRTPEYRKLGWVPYGVGETIPTDYCWRLKSASSTLGFAYNDWCAAQVAKGLGKAAAAAALEARSANWTNVWDAALVDKESGYRGFVHGRFPDGRFTDIEPRSGYQIYQRPGWQDYWGDFYEGSAWMYSYNVWHDLPRLIGLMGGREKFLERLSYAFDHDLIEYGNEPNFMTPWLFDFVGCPDLAGKWAHRFLENYPRRPHPGSGSPGDDDSGAMGSMYVFLTAGLYPIAGQDLYALHAPAAERIRFRLPASGKDFTILAPGARRGRSAFKSVKLNGKPLAEPFVRHSDFLAGGELRFELTGNKDD